MVSTLTVPRELNPTPETVIVSSTAAEAGLSVIDGFGVENSVELPVIVPIFTDTICVPGDSEPPVDAAGTSIIFVNAPLASEMMPPDGIASAPPIVMVDAVVDGGKAEPVIVTVFPVETLAGLTVITPLGTVTLTVFELLVVAVEPPTVSALSVTVT